MNYCSNCGQKLTRRIPTGDDHLRHVCTACGMVHYQNPKVVVGCIPLWEEQILICKRDIEPRRGMWTLPAGYLENGETTAQGAARETLEETGAVVEGLVPYRMYDIVHVHQIYLIFLARLKAPIYHPTQESVEVKLITEAHMPWEEIAFPVIQRTLKDFFRDRPTGLFPFATGRIDKALK